MSARDVCVCATVMVAARDGRPKAFVWAGDDGHGDASTCEMSEHVLWRSGEDWDAHALEEVAARCARCSIRSAGFNGVEVVLV